MRELDLGRVGTASQLLFGHMEDRWMDAAGGRQFSGTINWPVAGGWFVRGFGSGEEGYHLAVDVAGNIGWPARSVDAGIVAYAGDGIRGYGNIVMVIHPGGFVSFYAHLSATFVHSGEMVERGGSVRMWIVPEMLEAIRSQFGEGDFGAVQRFIDERICDAELLILDDLGAERPTPFAREQVFAIVDRIYRERHRGRRLIATSNAHKGDDDAIEFRVADRLSAGEVVLEGAP